jgi:hypothetical protein
VSAAGGAPRAFDDVDGGDGIHVMQAAARIHQLQADNRDLHKMS